jgi:hypothetical protein
MSGFRGKAAVPRIHKVIARKDGDWVRLYSRFGTSKKSL